MKEEHGEIVLDKPYELDSGLLPVRFPVANILGALAELESATFAEAEKIGTENLRRYRTSLPGGEKEMAMTTRGNRLGFMLSDLRAIARSHGLE